MKIIKNPRKKEPGFLASLFLTAFRAGILERSATLTYYFLFSLFPMLIVISVSLSAFHMDPGRIEEVLDQINVVPGLVVNLITAYVKEVATTGSPTLLILGIALTLYSMGRAVEILKRYVRLAFSSKPKKSRLSEWATSLIFVVLMLVGFYASLILVVAGNFLIRLLTPVFHFSDSLLVFFHSLRIAVPALYVFLLLTAIYAYFPGFRVRLRDAVPGAVFSMTSWVLVSWIFSFYVDTMNDYSTVYGSLGALIVLLVWLHLICVLILGGAHLNAALYQKKYGAFHDQLDSGIS